MSGERLPVQPGEVIDRASAVDFTWNGRRLSGHGGDTIASALMANGVRIVSRSMKYHRPRGYLTNDYWDPNAFVQVMSQRLREVWQEGWITDFHLARLDQSLEVGSNSGDTAGSCTNSMRSFANC